MGMPDARILARRLVVVETKLKKHEFAANAARLNILRIEPLPASLRSSAARLKVGRFHRK
jgi:hypothetical protein